MHQIGQRPHGYAEHRGDFLAVDRARRIGVGELVDGPQHPQAGRCSVPMPVGRWMAGERQIQRLQQQIDQRDACARDCIEVGGLRRRLKQAGDLRAHRQLHFVRERNGQECAMGVGPAAAFHPRSERDDGIVAGFPLDRAVLRRTARKCKRGWRRLLAVENHRRRILQRKHEEAAGVSERGANVARKGPQQINGAAGKRELGLAEVTTVEIGESARYPRSRQR